MSFSPLGNHNSLFLEPFNLFNEKENSYNSGSEDDMSIEDDVNSFFDEQKIHLFNDLCEKNKNLFNIDIFQEIEEGICSIQKIPNVKMDSIFFTTIKQNPSIGTSGVALCIALLGKGYQAGHSQKGEGFLSIAHLAGGVVRGFEEMYERFREKNCDRVKVYALGGCSTDEGSLENQIELLKLTDQYPNVFGGFLFNKLPEGSESFDVVLSLDKIIYSKGRLVSFENECGEEIAN